MKTFEFTAILDRPVVTDADHDRVFEAGLDDATPEGIRLHVAREADNLPDAILTIVADARQAGYVVVGLENEDLVTLEQIAERTSRSYESVRLLRTGSRGPGGFPAAESVGNYALYSWAQVADWFRDNLQIELPPTDDQVLSAANHILRARQSTDPETWRTLAPLAAAS